MDITEILARMWLQVDPNRGGSDPEEIMTEVYGDLKDQPHWKWFVPRAEASIEFLREHGYEVSKLTTLKDTP